MRAYLQLIIILAVIAFQSCRPSTNDNLSNGREGEPTGSTGSPSDSSGTDSATNTTNATTPGGDTTSSRKPMTGEVGSSGDFMTSAAEDGLTEVKLAELALERSKSSKIKKFAQMMLKDHNAANTELVSMAKDLRVDLPSSLCMECEAKYTALAKQKGRAFDSVYTQLMIKDHKAALEKFVFQSRDGSNDKIKKWAADKVPVLQHHLNAANALDDSVTVRKGTR